MSDRDDARSFRAVAAGRLLELSPQVALMQAVTPLNFVTECARITAARARGAEVRTRFVYPVREKLSVVVAELSTLSESLSARGEGALAARAREIYLEARLVDRRGQADFRALAAERFGSSPEDDARAEAYAAVGVPTEAGAPPTLHWTDDAADPGSLLSAVRNEVGRLRLPVRVLTSPSLASLAAAAGTTVVVAEGRRTTAREAQRTALHEVHGHVLPALARLCGGPFAQARVAGDIDREEGRALCLEEEAGFFDGARRGELGLRHVAARAAHEGASFVDVLQVLTGRDVSPERAVRLAARACRGGGLGRERVYLPAYFAERARQCATLSPCES